MMLQTLVIDWQSSTPQTLTHSADLCHLLDISIPGCLHVRRMPVIIIPDRIAHVIEKNDGRVKRLMDRPELILRALESPEIIEAKPEYRPDVGNYKITLCVEDEQEPGVYVGVAVSLANFPGEQYCDGHFVYTVYCPEYRTFFTPQGDIKPRWRRVDRMPWPR